jgi:glutamyl-tRNA synthetase
MTEVSRIYYTDFEEFDAGAARKHLRLVAEPALRTIAERLAGLQNWKVEQLDEIIQEVAAELGVNMGKIAQPLRVALAGTGVSPSIDKTLWLVGRERSLQRIERALEYIVARAPEA